MTSSLLVIPSSFAKLVDTQLCRLLHSRSGPEVRTILLAAHRWVVCPCASTASIFSVDDGWVLMAHSTRPPTRRPGVSVPESACSASRSAGRRVDQVTGKSLAGLSANQPSDGARSCRICARARRIDARSPRLGAGGCRPSWSEGMLVRDSMSDVSSSGVGFCTTLTHRRTRRGQAGVRPSLPMAKES